MQLKTTSEVIRFAQELEEEAAKLYENLATRYPRSRETFLLFAKESRKNKALVQRAYNEAVTDAIETGFSFKGLEVDSYLIHVDLAQDTDLSRAVKKALELEEKIQSFYATAAGMSKGLLTDISRVFERITKKRNERTRRLTSLL